MSAGGLSYSGLVNYGASTLPSVESWGTNMNILRDPPKSIMTRRINKVGETSSITEMIDDSGDRAAEAILVYPRGVNPMVSVSYSNYGNNGGSGQAGSLTGLNTAFTRLSGATSNTQAFLPYRIMNGQSFRPPIQSPQDLMPLSRQPRVWTSQFTTPGFVDFSRKLRDPGTACNTREVKTELLKAFIRPTEFRQIEKPIEQPNEVKYSIQKVMNLRGHSGTRTMDLTEQYVLKPSGGIYNNPLHANAVANKGYTAKYINNNGEFDTNKYIQDANSHSVLSNKTGMKQTNVNDIDAYKYIQDANAHSVLSNKIGMKQTNIDDVVDLDVYKYIQDSNTHSVLSNKIGMKQTSIDDVVDLDVYKYIQDANAHSVLSNKIGMKQTSIDDVVDVDVYKYIQDANAHSVLSNKIGTKQTNVNDIDAYKYIQDVNIIERNAPHSLQGDGTKYIHSDLDRNRILPNYQATTNNGDYRVHKNMESINQLHLNKNMPTANFQNGGFVVRTEDPNGKSKSITPKISPGGYMVNNYGKPLTQRIQQIPKLQESEKSRVSKFVMNEMHDRH